MNRVQLQTSYFAKAAALAITLLFSAVIYNFPTFFFIAPMSAQTWWLSVEQFLFVAGWVLFLVVPVLHLFAAEWVRLPRALVLTSFALWPLSLTLIHFSLWVATGDPYLQYLTDHPVFFLTDIVSPLFYWALTKSGLILPK
jgi:hypothetical protein